MTATVELLPTILSRAAFICLTHASMPTWSMVTAVFNCSFSSAEQKNVKLLMKSVAALLASNDAWNSYYYNSENNLGKNHKLET